MFLYTMWILVHPTYLVLSYGTLLYEIFCGCGLMFLIKNHVCLCVPTTTGKMNSIPQPQEQKSGRRTQCSSTPCECLCTQPIWYCCLQPFYMRYLVVHSWLKICLFVYVHQQQNQFQNIPISTGWCLLHWYTKQPSPYSFCQDKLIQLVIDTIICIY